MQDLEQFGHLPALLLGISGTDSVLDAVSHVILKDLLFDPAQGRTDGRNLSYDVNAVTILLQHPRQTTNLALDPGEAPQALGFGLVLHD
jgi:hypothetical protein